MKNNKAALLLAALLSLLMISSAAGKGAPVHNTLKDHDMIGLSSTLEDAGHGGFAQSEGVATVTGPTSLPPFNPASSKAARGASKLH
ncbi:hypothetical protein VPH35_098740 [Triticum aestivum]|uniref:Uncharacterized protein n=1 Tax=Aegilops tauschii TaxID=37682 RepID=M8BEY3_AEGTA